MPNFVSGKDNKILEFNSSTYTPDLAARLQKKYSLSDGTLRVWKHRGGIPLRYTEGAKQIERATKTQLKKIEAFLRNNWINRSGFEGIPGYRLNDFMRNEKRKTLSKSDVEQILGAEKLLKRSIKTIIEKRQIKGLSDLLAQPFLRPMLFIGNLRDYGRLRAKNKSMTKQDWDWIIKIIAEKSAVL